MVKLYGFHFLFSLVNAIFWSCWAATFVLAGYSLGDTALILAAIFIAQSFFEIPTGFWADLYGRKLMTNVGFGTIGIGFLIVGFSSSVSGYMAGFFTAGIGLTLMSGAMTAWLLNLAIDIGGEKVSSSEGRRHFFMNLHLFGRLATAAGAFGGIEILRRYPDNFWVIVGSITCTFFLFGLFVPKSSTDCAPVEERSEFKFSKLIPHLKRPALILAIVSVVCFGVEIGIRNLISQPYILEITEGQVIYLAYMQVMLAVIRLLGILAYRWTGMAKRVELHTLMLVLPMFWFGIAEIVTSQITNFWWFMLIYGSAIFSLGWFFPLRDEYINSIIPEKLRATLLSFDSTAFNLSAALVLFAVAGFANGAGIFDLWILAGISLLFSGSILLLSKKAV